MKLSWSQKLFVSINKGVGSRPRLDRAMRFCAHDLLYILAFLVMLWATTVLFQRSPILFNGFIKLLMTAGVLGFVTSWTIAFIHPHVRPIRELPHVHQLLSPFGTWKSFPSDHTIAAFTLAEMTSFMGVPLWFGAILFGCALCVSLGRVYVGVHYPRDIVGGIIIATLFSTTAGWLLIHVTQPLYSVFMTLF